MIFRQTTNSNFEFVSKRGVGPNDLLTNFRHKLCAGDGGATCSMPRVSGIDDAPLEQRRAGHACLVAPSLTLMTGRSSPKATSDLRSWKGTQIYAHGILCHINHKFRAKCGTPSAA